MNIDPAAILAVISDLSLRLANAELELAKCQQSLAASSGPASASPEEPTADAQS